MKKYQDINGDSGISTYEYNEESISIKFKNDKIYEYHASNIGPSHISKMKQLADSGDGLNAYINTNPVVKKGYSLKK